MSSKQGSLSITSENIFPVIKKWLYEDHDIFIRELISNGCDAISKLHKLDIMGEVSLPLDYKAKIQVTVNPEDKTLTFVDNGIGMTAEEVDKYINQIAFSGATDFLNKYKDKTSEDQIIGHFGLGFYSAFMVADTVEIDSLSCQEGATAVHWVCDGGTQYQMDEGDYDQVGTKITLHLNEDCLEFSNEYKVREVIEKYCSFMPTEIYLNKANAPEEYETIDASDLRETDQVVEEIHEDARYEEKEKEDGSKETVEVSPAKDQRKIVKRPVPLNDINPLWAKTPSDCTDDEYRDFYRKVFMDYKEPLFWIHLNMDYPFNLKGILYFPRINSEYESIEGTIKLYNNQVFVADNIKEVIPEYLMLLKGVIDCPDLPLNVSRSALQNDGFVRKISDYISKKVADKLSGLCKTDRENYEKYWEDIAPFIKYGCLKDNKFCDRMNDYILFKDIEGKFRTLPDLLVKPKESEAETSASSDPAEDSSSDSKSQDGQDTKRDSSDGSNDSNRSDDSDKRPEAKAETEENAPKEPEKKTVYYVTDEQQQSQYINMFKDQGMDAVVLNTTIDSSFITQLEQRNEHYQFRRIDSGLTDSMTEDVSDEDLKEANEALTALFRKALGNDKLSVSVAKFKDDSVSSLLTQEEEGRRMQDMMKMYGMAGMDPSMFPSNETLVLNVGNELVDYLFKHPDADRAEDFCHQLYDLAVLANHPLSPEEMTAFIARSNRIMLALAK
nr:molecular chaperone HtpG [uncultured Shuttleworthia sp.]